MILLKSSKPLIAFLKKQRFLKSSYIWPSLGAFSFLGAIGAGVVYAHSLYALAAVGACLFLISGAAAYKTIQAWRRHDKSEFRFKVTSVLSLFVVLPCVIMAIFAVLFLEIGVQAWFHTRVKTALHESHEVAQAYLNEHKKVLEYTIMTMAGGLNTFLENLSGDRKFFPLDPEVFFNFYRKELDEYLTVHEAFRSVREAIIFSVMPECEDDRPAFVPPSPYASIKILSRSQFSLALGAKVIRKKDLKEAQDKGISLFFDEQGGQVFALIPVFHPLEAYLLISRDIDAQVLKRVHRTTEAVGAYDNLLKEQHEFSLKFIIVFYVFTFILLCMAIWGGILFSRQVMDPVSALVNVSQHIREGKMETVDFKDMKTLKELHILMTTFNAMVEEMSHQKQALLQMNQYLNERTHFIEGALEGISSGVLSLASTGEIILANPRAQELLQQRKPLEGKRLGSLIEEFIPLFEKALLQPGELISDQLTVMRLGRFITFRVHTKAYCQAEGVILTFDDITTLITAQKKTAWEDVARRIAHEVKNPLTPIMLSAERLKRKYLPRIQERPDVFQDCIETIIRQVSHIGKLISEFSAFARMPAPVMRIIDFDELVHQIIALQKEAYPHICFSYERQPLEIECDPHQLEQVLINVLKNAIESIEERNLLKGLIQLCVEDQGDKIVLQILDNGGGLSQPFLGQTYASTKSHGLGLGLAIVQKIIHDHRGLFTLQQRQEGPGAWASITLRKSLTFVAAHPVPYEESA